MDFVVDTNIIISSLIASSGKTREIIFSDEIKLLAPELLLREIVKHEKEIMRKSGLTRQELKTALTIISTRMEFVPYKEFKKFIKMAKRISPDANDAEFIALALAKNAAIWSNDKVLKKQVEVKVFTTAEIAKIKKL